MDRTPDTLTIDELSHQFVGIDFPEYQREPDVWTREQKQRLLDSIFRQFDIASIYLFLRDDAIECIDGRQRLNAIMSFLGANPLDDDNGFALKFTNEVSSAAQPPYPSLDGCTFAEIETSDDPAAADAIQMLLAYPVSVVYLAGELEPDEFNLQFLRLNLGTLINAGEKLNAMVGAMRDLLFDAGGIGQHPFFSQVRIPTRRFAREQAAAQVMLEVFAKHETGEFARARHFDLQRFLKRHSEIPSDEPLVGEVKQVLDWLDAALQGLGDRLRNRAMTVSVVLLVWAERLHESGMEDAFRRFLSTFLGRLKWQVANMKEFTPNPRYEYLVDFQRHLTQASVEKPALTRRHQILASEWAKWREDGALTGDAAYRSETGDDPPTL